jgi:hypothetical protein
MYLADIGRDSAVGEGEKLLGNPINSSSGFAANQVRV